jgi:hypothetical protein
LFGLSCLHYSKKRANFSSRSHRNAGASPDSPVLQAFSRGILPPPVGRETYGKLRDISFFLHFRKHTFRLFLHFRNAFPAFIRQFSQGIFFRNTPKVIDFHTFNIHSHHRAQRAKKVGTLLAK